MSPTSALRIVRPWLRFFWGRLRRSRSVLLATAAVVAVASGLTVQGAVDEARVEARRLGSTLDVAVITSAVEAGEVLGPGDYEIRRLPVALLPDSPLVERPAGRIALTRLVPGDVVVAARVGPDGLTGPAALLPSGRKAIAVEVTGSTPPLATGDRVDVMVTFPPEAAAAEPTVTVARRALVVHVGDDAVTVAVSASEAPKVAYALATGVVALALAGA
jgi:Flp pilus assembly protein CpaB